MKGRSDLERNEGIRTNDRMKLKGRKIWNEKDATGGAFKDLESG
jgi:hypothetical protein